MNDNFQLALKTQANLDKSALLQLALSNNPEEVVLDLNSKDIPTQLKAFMLTQAKSELVRVIQLTDALNELEDTYIRRALLDKEGMDMRQLSHTIDVVMKSLNRSMELINRVTNNQDLKVIIDQSTKIYNASGGNNISILADQNSREKLRNLASKLFSAITTNPNEIVNSSPIDDSNIIEAEYTTVTPLPDNNADYIEILQDNDDIMALESSIDKLEESNNDND